MSVSNGIISAPVSIEDVATCLGVGSYDLGTLCQSSKINMWAKYKPVTWDSVNINITNPNWFKGSDGLCGLKIPNESGSPDNIYNSTWAHAKPASYFRLLDFEGYNPKSTYLITSWLPDKTITLNKDNPKLTIQLALFAPTVKNNLQIADCQLLSNFRLAVKIKKSNGNSYLLTSQYTAVERVNESGILNVNIDFSTLTTSGTETYTITQFLTTTSSPEISTFPTIITCYAIPNYLEGYTNRISVQYSAVSPGITMTCEGLANALNGTYNSDEYYMTNPFQVKNNSYEYWKLKVVNNSTTAKTIKVGELQWTGPNAEGDDKTSTYNDDLKMYNSSKSEVQSITIAANSTSYMYIRSRIFSKNVSMYSGMAPIYGIWKGLYTNTNEGITNRMVGRFESAIQGSI